MRDDRFWSDFPFTFILYLDSLTYQLSVSWSVGWLVSRSFGWLVGRLAGWLVGWLVSQLIGYSVYLFDNLSILS